MAFQVLQERKLEYKKRKAEEAAMKARKASGVLDEADDNYRNYRLFTLARRVSDR